MKNTSRYGRSAAKEVNKIIAEVKQDGYVSGYDTANELNIYHQIVWRKLAQKKLDI